MTKKMKYDAITIRKGLTLRLSKCSCTSKKNAKENDYNGKMTKATDIDSIIEKLL